MNHPFATRQALLGEAAAFLTSALEKLDAAACDLASVHAAHALDLVEELLATGHPDQPPTTGHAGA